MNRDGLTQYETQIPIPAEVAGRRVTNRGVHLLPGSYHAGWMADPERREFFLDLLVAMDMSWVLIIFDGGSGLEKFDGLEVIRHLLERGIIPVGRDSTEALPKPYNNHENIRRMVPIYAEYGAPLLVQGWNEPGDDREGDVSGDWFGRYCDLWNHFAGLILSLGAYPGFADGPDYDFDEHHPFLRTDPAIWATGLAWFAMHNYGKGRPVDYPYDVMSQFGTGPEGQYAITEEQYRAALGVYAGDRAWWLVPGDEAASVAAMNQLRDDSARPGITTLEDATCWLAWERVAWHAQDVLGFVPLMGMTEGGWTPRDHAGSAATGIDDRWPLTTPAMVAMKTLQMYETPSPLRFQCPWLLANALMGGGGWEDDAWYGGSFVEEHGLAKPVIEVLVANPSEPPEDPEEPVDPPEDPSEEGTVLYLDPAGNVQSESEWRNPQTGFGDGYQVRMYQNARWVVDALQDWGPNGPYELQVRVKKQDGQCDGLAISVAMPQETRISAFRDEGAYWEAKFVMDNYYYPDRPGTGGPYDVTMDVEAESWGVSGCGLIAGKQYRTAIIWMRDTMFDPDSYVPPKPEIFHPDGRPMSTHDFSEQYREIRVTKYEHYTYEVIRLDAQQGAREDKPNFVQTITVLNAEGKPALGVKLKLMRNGVPYRDLWTGEDGQIEVEMDESWRFSVPGEPDISIAVGNKFGASDTFVTGWVKGQFRWMDPTFRDRGYEPPLPDQLPGIATPWRIVAYPHSFTIDAECPMATTIHAEVNGPDGFHGYVAAAVVGGNAVLSIDGLQPATLYACKLWGSNVVGDGPDFPFEHWTLDEVEPPDWQAAWEVLGGALVGAMSAFTSFAIAWSAFVEAFDQFAEVVEGLDGEDEDG